MQIPRNEFISNFKEHCKWTNKNQLGFGEDLDYRPHSGKISPLFADLSFVHYACLRLCSAIVHFIQNNCLYFVCYG